MMLCNLNSDPGELVLIAGQSYRCSGFATIAGSVLIAYISLGVNAQALVSSCKLIFEINSCHWNQISSRSTFLQAFRI